MDVGQTVEMVIEEAVRGKVTRVVKKSSSWTLGEPVGHVHVEWEDGLQEGDDVDYAYEGPFIEVKAVNDDDPRSTDLMDATVAYQTAMALRR